jgi:hypothetical protein
MQVLRSAPPGRLTAGQEDMLRELADTVIFATDYDSELRDALASARALLLVLPGPLDAWTDAVALEIERCAPPRSLAPRLSEPLGALSSLWTR